jgi:hypothetical protein
MGQLHFVIRSWETLEARPQAVAAKVTSQTNPLLNSKTSIGKPLRLI